MDATVQVSYPSKAVCLIAIDRAERRNALDVATYEQLGDALLNAERDDAVRVVVMAGKGAHFTAGNDLEDFFKLEGAASVPGIDFLRVLAGLSKPVIAAVEGYAIGIGTTLLLHCDLAYAGQHSTFRLPFVSLGLVPEGASTYWLPRLAGSKKASELLLFGEVFTSEVALEVGLLNEVVEQGQALEKALERATTLAALPQVALRHTKRLLLDHQREAVQRAMDEEEQAFLARCASVEAKAAFDAFLKRR